MLKLKVVKKKLTVENIFLLAVKSYKEKKFLTAEKYYKEILEKHPNHTNTLLNLGMTLKQLEKYKEAKDCYKKAIKINPNYENSYYNLANLYNDLNKYDEAIKFYKKTIQINPNFLGAYNNLGNIFKNLNEYESATKFYNKAIQIDPNNAVLYNNLGLSYNEVGELALALKFFYKAFKINPNIDYLFGSLIQAKHCMVEWNSFDKELEDLSYKIINKNKVCTPWQSLLFFNSSKLQNVTAKTFVKEKYSNKNDLKSVIIKRSNKKIRIGYYSADFRNHAVGQLIVGLFELHDSANFEIFCFYYGPDVNDEIHNRIKNSVDKFINVRLKNEKEIAELSRNLQIDIAIDLMGHTKRNRFKIFVERCAAIQVSYIGYLGTQGSKCFDYIIADKTTIPEKNQKYFSEKIIYMPDTFLVSDSSKKISDKNYTREELGLPKKAFVFCCFNQLFKLSPEVFDIWMNLLKSKNNSVLWILPQNETAAKNLYKEAKKRNVDPKRIIFAKYMKMPDHLARHKAADLFIDTFPFTAATAASDALWAGLPVLTRVGETFVSRIAASLLNSIGLNELITYTKKEYENKAIELANNAEKLKEIKKILNKNKIIKPLFNTKLFTSNLEIAYLDIYKKYFENKKPINIEIK